jgi:hypothetical protein
MRLDEEENDILGERRDHKTSDTAYVFVPFEQVSAQFTSRHSTPRRHDATTLTHAHRRSPTLTDAHRRSPTLTDAHRRSPTLTDAHPPRPQVNTHVLNLGVDKLDYFVAG